MTRIKGVIFDLDGTIADTLPLCIRAFRQSISPLAKRFFSDEEIIAHFGPSEEGTIRALVPDHYEQGIADYLRFYESLHDICPAPFPGIPALLIHLKERSIRIGMVTGKGKYSTALSLERFGLASIFDPVKTGSPFGPAKAEGIGAVLQQWKDLRKEEIIYVGDAPGDITASKRAGIAIIAAAWAATVPPAKLKELHPDELFFSIDECSHWLRSKI
jgi:phosphoglycolate phosphatase-like HAD superfamily hydrolase